MRYQVNRFWESEAGPERKEDGYVVVDTMLPYDINREVSRVFKTRKGADNFARKLNGTLLVNILSD